MVKLPHVYSQFFIFFYCPVTKIALLNTPLMIHPARPDVTTLVHAGFTPDLVSFWKRR
jgi:hypothetical protein